MKIDRLIDSWSDPLFSLYEREVRILMKGIGFLPQESSQSFGNLMRVIYSTVISSRRNDLILQSDYMNFSIFSDENLEVTFMKNDQSQKETFKAELDSRNNIYILSLYNKYKEKHTLSDKDFVTKITLMNKGESRIRFEKHLFKNSAEDVANVFIQRINEFIEHSPTDIYFRDFLNNIMREKDLLSLEMIDHRISLDEDQVLILDHLAIDRIKELKEKAIQSFEKKGEYLKLFEK